MSNTGRSRLNINGAYNPRSKEIIYRNEVYRNEVYRNEESINPKSTRMLILDILDKYPNAKKLHKFSQTCLNTNKNNFIKRFKNS
jgi:hypothetical protein